MFKDLKSFDNTKFEIKGVKFSVSKLPPMDGFKMAEEIRVNLAMTADKFDAGDGSEQQSMVLFFKSLLGLDPIFVDDIRSRLFKHVQFSGDAANVKSGWVELDGLEDQAFEKFEVINIYEVLARALFINFHGSFSAITSTFPGVAQILKQRKQKT